MHHNYTMGSKHIINLLKKVYLFLPKVFDRLISYFILNHSYKHGELQYLDKYKFSIWRSSLLSMQWVSYCNLSCELVRHFAKAKINLVKNNIGKLSRTKPILIVVVKDDVDRMKYMFQHYRKLSVKQFVVLDNGSKDGTLEWVKDQEDTILYQTKEKYRGRKKEAWVNRIISHYGFDRWYIIVDSDEMLTYVDMENKSIEDLINVLMEKGIHRCQGVLLDMYRNEAVSSEVTNTEYDLINDYCYFDTKHYRMTDFGIMDKTYIGGPRARIFNSITPLTKCPFLFFREGDLISSAHFNYPYEKNVDAPYIFGILHFKFLPSDWRVYKKRAMDGNFANGSAEYKKYIRYFEKKDTLTFMYSGSQKFENSFSLQKLPFLYELFQ